MNHRIHKPCRRPHFAPVAMLASLLLLGGLIAGASGVGAQEAGIEVRERAESDEGFYDLEELERIFEVARESGFSEEELRQITIEDAGEQINAWEYLQKRREREAAEAAREKERREKVYLTVKEIVDELNEDRAGDLSELRDETYYAE